MKTEAQNLPMTVELSSAAVPRLKNWSGKRKKNIFIKLENQYVFFAIFVCQSIKSAMISDDNRSSRCYYYRYGARDKRLLHNNALAGIGLTGWNYG